MSNKLKKKIGSRAQVWNGTSLKTSGGLTIKDLQKNSKTGRIVSKKKRILGKIAYIRNGLKPKSKKELDKIRKLRYK
jgi:hypothetical protein